MFHEGALNWNERILDDDPLMSMAEKESKETSAVFISDVDAFVLQLPLHSRHTQRLNQRFAASKKSNNKWNTVCFDCLVLEFRLFETSEVKETWLLSDFDWKSSVCSIGRQTR